MRFMFWESWKSVNYQHKFVVGRVGYTVAGLVWSEMEPLDEQKRSVKKKKKNIPSFFLVQEKKLRESR